MRYYYRSTRPANECRDFADLVSRIRPRDLTLTRSTVPLLAYWLQTEGRLAEVLRLVFGAGPVEPGKFLAERSVRSGVRRSAPSQSDLFYEDPLVGLAIEGKWTEGRYPTVEKWLRRGRDRRHRERVLEAWCAMIRPFTADGYLEPEAVRPVVYQMLHRTASACSRGRQSAGVVFQHFRMDGVAHTPLGDDIALLSAALRPSERLRIVHQTIDIQPTPAYIQLRDRAPDLGPERIAEGLRSALAHGELFTFAPGA